ncbi:MAG: hypothetical protein HQK66_15685 [Desulfamplus sp.]|nr:hypothetical protein [Desulfamplus sp.]
MTLVIKSTYDDTISLPEWLMKNLNLNEGEEVKMIIEGKTLRLSSLDKFLSLRGTLSNDDEVESNINLLNSVWDSWKI